jgi:hypothetical protein
VLGNDNTCERDFGAPYYHFHRAELLDVLSAAVPDCLARRVFRDSSYRLSAKAGFHSSLLTQPWKRLPRLIFADFLNLAPRLKNRKKVSTARTGWA